MPRFLAVYIMSPESLARFYTLTKTEQDAIDAAGLPKWTEWEKQHIAHFADKGGMVGKTLRVSREGTAPATNSICGYVTVEAETIENAAKLFENHPHFSIFPGDSVDIMPFVTEANP